MKRKKQRWYVITYKNEDNTEEIIGFTQALAFSREKDAKQKFKEWKYRRPKRNIRIMYF